MQLKKLAVLCNACFWLTLFFQFWKNARNLPPWVLGTIIIIGLLSVLVNIAWLLVAGRRRSQKEWGDAKPPGRWQTVGALALFNILSFIAQLILLCLKFV